MALWTPARASLSDVSALDMRSDAAGISARWACGSRGLALLPCTTAALGRAWPGSRRYASAKRLADDLRDQLLRGCEQRHAFRILMLVTSGDSRVSDPHRRTVSETSISVT